MEGPVGFSNMDKAGLLTFGYDQLNTMITWYHNPYQKDHLEKLKMKNLPNGLSIELKYLMKMRRQKKLKSFLT